MKKKLSISLILFVVFVTYLTPAKLIENMMPQQPGLSLSGFSGSVWSGAIQSVSTRQFSFSDIQFSFEWLSLLSFSPSVTLDIPKGDVVGDLSLGLTADPAKSLSAENINIELDAKLLESMLPIRGIKLGGLLQTDNLDIDTKERKARLVQGIVHWKNAMVNATGQEFSLGDFSLQTETDEAKGVITAKLLKTKNALSLEGKLTLKPDGMLEFIGSIATNIDQSLYNTMVLFNDGKPAGGRLPLKFKKKVSL